MKNIRRVLLVILFFTSSYTFSNEPDETEEIIVIASRIPTLASDVIGSVESISSEAVSYTHLTLPTILLV